MIDKKKVESAITSLIDALGYDINDQNFRETPKRVADMLRKYWKEISMRRNQCILFRVVIW